MRRWFGPFLVVFISGSVAFGSHAGGQPTRWSAQESPQPKLPPGVLAQTTALQGECSVIDGSFSAKGDRFLTAHRNGAVRYWNPVTGKAVDGPFADQKEADSKSPGWSSPDGRYQIRYEKDG